MKNRNSFFTISGHIKFLKHLLIYKYPSKKNRAYIKSTQLYRFLPLYPDRLLELVLLYPITLKQLMKIFSKYDFPSTDYFKEKFIKDFGPSSPEHLFNSYKELDVHYTMRLMMAYHRVDFIEPYVDYILKYFNKKKIRVLDYGAGVSDIGIFLAAKGCEVTIVDLGTQKIQFTQKRFRKRGLCCKIIKVTDTESLPEIKDSFDIIIATEIIEHFRYPTKLVDFFHFLLNENGLLLNNMGPEFERERGADHLDESLDEGNTKAYWANYWKKFKLIKVKNAHPWLFQKS